MAYCSGHSIQAKRQTTPTLIGKDQYALPPGQTIIALLPAIHRDTSIWGEDADKFRPERMTENKTKIPATAWKAFGNGSRSCIGRQFAITEMVLVTAMIAQNFDLELLDPDYELEIDQIITPRLKDLNGPFRRAFLNGYLSLDLIDWG